MKISRHILIWYIAAGLVVLASCASRENTAIVRDDVYARPTGQTVAVIPPGSADDEYYDPDAAAAMTEKSYYDVAYNDPYYYNYGRFGFGGSVGAVGPTYGYGDPFSNYSYGSFGTGYGWNSGWASGFGVGAGWGYGGWGMPMYDPYWGYNGYGPYYGPWGGTCYGCYSPMVICPSNVVVQHRPSFSNGTYGDGSSTTLIPRMHMRDPAGLLTVPAERPGRTPTLTPRPSTVHDENGTRTGSQRSSTREGRPSHQGARPAPTSNDSPQRSGNSSPSLGGGTSRPSMGGSRPR